MALTQNHGQDSVKRHRKWQAGLDKEAFFKRIKTAHAQVYHK
jgi:hypothetical protein